MGAPHSLKPLYFSAWWYVSTPLKNIFVRQLGLWHSKYFWKVIIQSCSRKTTNQYIMPVLSTIKHYSTLWNLYETSMKPLYFLLEILRKMPSTQPTGPTEYWPYCPGPAWGPTWETTQGKHHVVVYSSLKHRKTIRKPSENEPVHGIYGGFSWDLMGFYGKSPCLMVRVSINGPCSIAM